MPIKIRGDLRIRRSSGPLIPSTALRLEGQLLIQRVQVRTKSGVSSAGVKFVPYTEAYAARKGVSPSHVTLTATGKMLAGLSVLSARDGVVQIGFREGELANRAAYNEVRRPFLDPDETWIQQMVKGLAASMRL